MKAHFLASLSCALLLAGCGGDSGSSSGSSQNPVDATAESAGSMANSKKLAEKVVDTTALNQAVQLFYAQEGKYPASLDELVKQNYLSRLPEPPVGMKFDYNARSGEFKVVPK